RPCSTVAGQIRPSAPAVALQGLFRDRARQPAKRSARRWIERREPLPLAPRDLLLRSRLRIKKSRSRDNAIRVLQPPSAPLAQPPEPTRSTTCSMPFLPC